VLVLFANHKVTRQTNPKKTLIQKQQEKSSSNSTGSRSFTGPLRIQTPGSNSEPSNIAARFQDAWNVAPGRRMDDGPARHLQRPHVGPCWPFNEIPNIKSHNGLKNSKNSCIQNPGKLKQMRYCYCLLSIFHRMSFPTHQSLTLRKFRKRPRDSSSSSCSTIFHSKSILIPCIWRDCDTSSQTYPREKCQSET